MKGWGAGGGGGAPKGGVGVCEGVQSKSTDGNRQEVDGGRTDPASNTPQSCPQVLPAQSQVGGKKVHKSISSQVHKSTDLASTVSGGWEERSTEFGTICSPEDIWVHLGDRLQRNIAQSSTLLHYIWIWVMKYCIINTDIQRTIQLHNLLQKSGFSFW